MINDKNFLFKSPTILELENGVTTKAGKYVKKFNAKKTLIVTDKILSEQGIIDPLKIALDNDEVEYVIYDNTQPEPPVENCYEAFSLYKENGCEVVIGIGGGSSLDVSKIVAMMATNPGKFEDYVGIGNVPNKCAPLILMPTTSGTGSEVSNFSIMICNESKMGVVDPNIIADVALVDPLLTKTVPRTITAATGIDALCHHFESFLSTNASPICDMFCLEGIRVIGKYLRVAVGNGDNEEARYWMSYASTLGGYVMNLTDGAAANHGLAFAIGAKYHVGHGLSNAVMIPHVLKVVGVAEMDKVKKIGEALGLSMEDIRGRRILDVVVDEVKQLVSDVGCLIPISEFGAVEGDIDELTEEVVRAQTRVMGHSTYKLTSDEIKDVFREAL